MNDSLRKHDRRVFRFPVRINACVSVCDALFLFQVDQVLAVLDDIAIVLSACAVQDAVIIVPFPLSAIYIKDAATSAAQI